MTAPIWIFINRCPKLRFRQALVVGPRLLILTGQKHSFALQSLVLHDVLQSLLALIITNVRYFVNSCFLIYTRYGESYANVSLGLRYYQKFTLFIEPLWKRLGVRARQLGHRFVFALVLAIYNNWQEMYLICFVKLKLVFCILWLLAPVPESCYFRLLRGTPI